MVTFNDYINALKTYSIRKPIMKVEFLRQEDETPLKQVTTQLRLDGGLNIQNKNGVRRTLDFTLDNITQEYFPSLDSTIWLGQKFKLYLGMMVNNEEYYLPQGIFVHDSPSVSDDGGVNISGADKFSLLDGSMGGEIDLITIIASGLTVDNVIKSLMSLSQDPKDPIIDTELGSQIVPYQIILEEGDNLGKALTDLAFSFSANVFYNEEGHLVFEPDTPDNIKGSVWDFDGDSISEKDYQNGDAKYDFSEVYNRILVIGNNVNGTIVRAVVENNDLLSDTSIPNIGLTRTFVVKDDIIYTVQYCIERGKYELKRRTSVLTSGGYNFLPLWHLDVDKVVTVNEDRINMNKKRKLIQSLNIPLDSTSSASGNFVDTFDIDL